MPVARGPGSWPHQLASSICLQGCCACRPLSMDVCRHCCSEGSYRELGASFPGPHLQPPESEANKGVHPEEGGRAPKDRLHPFPPQPALPRGLLALQPLDLLGAEEARTAVRRDPQTACGYTSCCRQTMAAHGMLQASNACVELGTPPSLSHRQAAAVYLGQPQSQVALALVA